MSEELFDIEGVFCLVIQHCCLPVSKSVQRYLLKPWILKRVCKSFSCSLKYLFECVIGRVSENFWAIVPQQVFQHSHELIADPPYARVTPFLRFIKGYYTPFKVYVCPFKPYCFTRSHSCFFKQLKEGCKFFCQLQLLRR